VIAELESSAGRKFEQFYSIYTGSLVARERKKRHEIEGLIGRPGYRVFVLEESGDVLAFSIVFVARAVGVALLEYMATDKARRNAGLGGEIFAQSLGRIDGLPLLVEVDSERENADDRDMRARRKRFYRRCGCLEIANLAYRLPLPGVGAPPEMDLMVHSNGAQLVLSKARLRQWLEAVFADVYGQRADDPRIAAMLSSVNDPVSLVG
jgi:hypothetical protein